jgi:hypothetical protein
MRIDCRPDPMFFSPDGSNAAFCVNAHDHGSLPWQLEVVCFLLLQGEQAGLLPSPIPHGFEVLRGHNLLGAHPAKFA